MSRARFSRPEVVPGTMSIDALLHRVDEGQLLFPSFQRPFAWTPQQMREVFESIERGFPIGSLVLWNTTERLAISDHVGPLRLPEPPKSGSVAYLVDGLQRLTTLYAVLRLPEDHPHGVEDEGWKWWIYRDLSVESSSPRSFVHVPEGEPAPHHFFPLRAVIRTMDFLAFSRALKTKASPSLDKELLVRRAEALVQHIKSYSLSTLSITGGTSDEALTIFERLNSAGTPKPS